MKYLQSLLVAAVACSLPSVAMAKTAANGYTAAEPVPLDYWAVRAAVGDVALSPDGEHIAIQRISSKDGDPIIEVYKTDDLRAEPLRINAEPMEFLGGVTWISDETFFGQAMQVVNRSVKRAEDDVRRYRNFSYNIEDQEFETFSTPSGGGVFNLVNLLPEEPRHILIGTSNGPSAAASDDPFEAFRPQNFYRLDIDNGTRSLVYRGNAEHPQPAFDNEGNPRLSVSVDTGSDEFVYYYRGKNDGSWREIMRLGAAEWDEMDFAYVADVESNPDLIYVLARHDGDDKIALWEFDVTTAEFGRKVYGNPDADVSGIFTGNALAGDTSIKGVRYAAAKNERVFFDADEKALYDTIRPAIKNAFELSITGRSRDGKVMTVYNRAPNDSGTHYLINNGKLTKLGSSNPLLKDEDYSNVEYIKYPARDGKMIPAYVTYPKGDGPFPLIVLPHGGPYVSEVIVYDEWGQMLANNGYMVIQPQYRGSEGHGWDHFISTWHEHGGAMNDDKDDGAKYLIEQGLVDPDRVAMFGWSYGGYAALVAASREDQIYQCTIPAAFVADPLMSYNGRKNDSIKYFDDFSAQRGGKVGINPMDEVEKVNVPMLLIHPEWDRRVLFRHYTKYKKALEDAGKADMMEFLPIEGADHFLYTHRYEHNIEYMSAILDYLKNDCGPGGL